MQMFIKKRMRDFISNMTSFISLKAHLKMIFFVKVCTGMETEMNIKRREMSENYFRQQPLDAPFHNLSVPKASFCYGLMFHDL